MSAQDTTRPQLLAGLHHSERMVVAPGHTVPYVSGIHHEAVAPIGNPGGRCACRNRAYCDLVALKARDVCHGDQDQGLDEDVLPIAEQ